jgi:hypothetical protein
MKKILFLVFLVLSAGAESFAQCEKKLVFSSSKTDHIENGSINRRSAYRLMVKSGG